ncbi:hypothetical protein KEM54_006105 [Ascosphaera aggregata]|nr:hypothetical protein KEM54_006105 [Ascosphaera aggregata]
MNSPQEVVQCITARWPCRVVQVEMLTYLLSARDTPSPSNLIIHGPQATGKSTILNAVLEGNEPQTDASVEAQSTPRKRKRSSFLLRPKLTQPARIPWATVKCAECITARHLLVKLVSRTIATLAALLGDIAEVDADKWAAEMHSKAKCDHISQLPDAMRIILEESDVFAWLQPRDEGYPTRKMVLVLDGVDNLREGGPMLLAGLARTAQLAPSLTIVYVFRQSPRPFLLSFAGVPHIYFPPYDRDECIEILKRQRPDMLDLVKLGFTQDYMDAIYTSYLGLVYDALIGPTASVLPVFRHVANKLWPEFVAPILNGEKPPGFAIDEDGSPSDWDFPRLVIRSRALFRQQGEALLVRHIIPDTAKRANDQVHSTTSNASKETASKLYIPHFPYLPTLLLASAFLAAHIPPRLDVVFFSKYASSASSKNKRRTYRRQSISVPGRTPSKSANEADRDLDDRNATPSKTRRPAETRITKSIIESSLLSSSSSSSAPGVIQSRPFPLERLLAIFHAISSNSVTDTRFPSTKSLSDTVFSEIATLQRLRLLVPAHGSASAIDVGGSGEKWILNASIAVGNQTGNGLSGMGSFDWIIEMAKRSGIEIEDYIANGLD